MSYIEQVEHGESGKIHEAERNPQDIIATRPFLTRERLGIYGRRRRGARLLPEVITTKPDGISYAVDGHHKIRRACDAGSTSILCRVLEAANPKLIAKLRRRNHGPQLPIR